MGKVAAINKKALLKYNEAVDLIHRVICVDDKPASHKSTWEQALALGMHCQEQDKQNSEYNYLVGYIYYNAPIKSIETREKADLFLKRAIEINPKHYLAHYFLACLYFDLRRYKDSLGEQSAILDHTFDECGQLWRPVKIFELQLCCNLYLNPFVSRLNDANRLLRLHKSFADPLLVPLPMEFAVCITFLMEQNFLHEKENTILCQICRSIFALSCAEDLLLERCPIVYTESNKMDHKTVQNVK